MGRLTCSAPKCAIAACHLASIFAGALSPLIATGLMTAYRPETWPTSIYMIGLALIKRETRPWPEATVAIIAAPARKDAAALERNRRGDWTIRRAV